MWFRLHTHLLHNSKAQALPPHLFKAWINILCMAKEGDGVIPPVEQIAFHLRLRISRANEIMRDLEDRGFCHPEQGGTFSANDWDAHQYKSDDVNTRVREHRKRYRNVSVTPSETDTDTESEAEQSQSRKTVAVATANSPKKSTKPASIGTRIQVEILPDDWAMFALTDCGMDRIRAQKVFDQFKDYWLAATGPNARKNDWFATWRNWCRREGQARASPAAAVQQPKLSFSESVAKVMKQRIAEGRPPL